MLVKDENVREVSEGGPIGDYSRKTDLRIVVVDAKTERVFNRTPHDVFRNILRPVRSSQETMHDFEIKPLRVAANRVLIALPFGRHVNARDYSWNFMTARLGRVGTRFRVLPGFNANKLSKFFRLASGTDIVNGGDGL